MQRQRVIWWNRSGLGLWRLILVAFMVLPLWQVAPTLAADEHDCSRPKAVTENGRDAMIAGLSAVVQASAACQTDGDWQTYASLVTENYLGEVYGGGGLLERADFLALTNGLPIVMVRYRGLDDVKTIREGEVRANVRTIVGNQLVFEQVTFREEKKGNGVWQIDSTTPLTPKPPSDHDKIEVTITGNHYVPDKLTASPGNVAVHIINQDKTAHEFLLLELATGATVGTILISPGGALPDGISLMAQLTVPAQTDGMLVLVNMKPGTYAIVDLLPNEQGLPWLASGMQATLTITAST
ncbi:MAG TPA: cupredoxin domain-containing protein [Thermomicrobiales bacterium]|nr:cupredoxin domain-containing protein [Thermomicrobiales bacterium]